MPGIPTVSATALAVRTSCLFAALLLAACAQAPGTALPSSSTAGGGEAAAARTAAPPRPTCAEAPPDLHARQRELAAEINLARTDPRGYAGLVEAHYRTLGPDKILRQGPTLIAMIEGRPAVDEAIAFLRGAQPRAPLVLDTCLSLAAQQHAVDRGAVGGFGHVGSDGSQPSERAARHIGGPARCAENLGYGHESAREHVMGMIVDDGVAGRGHRQILFDTRFRWLGVGVAAHRTYKTIAVELLCI